MSLQSWKNLAHWLWLFSLLAAIILCASLAKAQVDVQVPRANQQYIVAARNAVFGTSGAVSDCTKGSCGFNNNWIFPALYAQETICVTVYNTSASNENFNFMVSAVNDPGVVTYTGNTSRWAVPIAADGTISTGGSTGVNAGSFAQYYFQVSGASRVVLIFSNSTLATGADIVISQSSTASYSSNPGQIVSTTISGNSADLQGINDVQIAGQVIQTGFAPPYTSSMAFIPIISPTGKGSIITSFPINPFLIGCDVGGGGSVVAGKLQYVDCDSIGRLLVSGQTGVGTALAGLNPLAAGFQDGSGNSQFVAPSTPLPVALPNAALDPCQNGNIAKSSVFKNITTATTTAVIASSGSTVIYVCGYNLVMTGTTTADTIFLEDGTGAACVTTQVQKTPNYSSGILTNGATAFTVGFGGQTVFSTASSGEVCAVTGTVATTPTISLMVTYVQQ